VEPVVVPEVPQTLAEKMKFAWVQSVDRISVTYYVKGLTKEKVAVDFVTKSMQVKLAPLSDGSEYASNVDLFGAISPAECSVQVTGYKVIVTLKKADLLEWKDLFATDMGEVVQRPNVKGRFEGPTYPTSSKKKSNWSEVEKQAAKEEEAEKPEGDAALTKLFQQIYSKADDDTRRAMIKSYQTSGGTVLSTNWGEVEKANYDRDISAPKGMEVHRWNE